MVDAAAELLLFLSRISNIFFEYGMLGTFFTPEYHILVSFSHIYLDRVSKALGLNILHKASRRFTLNATFGRELLLNTSVLCSVMLFQEITMWGICL